MTVDKHDVYQFQEKLREHKYLFVYLIHLKTKHKLFIQ